MNEIPTCVLESVAAQEHLMCRLILDYAKAFYQDPKNQAAYLKWRKERSKK